MINIAMNSKSAFDRDTLLSGDLSNVQGTINSQNIETLNKRRTCGNANPVTSRTEPPSAPPHAQNTPQPPQTPSLRQIPALTNPVQKGQKVSMEKDGPIRRIKAGFGWNTTNPQCDVDVSAFLLGSDDKVLGDSWFVFYGQTTSPDQSTVFHDEDTADCETITIDFQKLNPDVKKIVFVLTINEAFEKNLNFGMMKDAYVRILNADNLTEFVSFKMTDYYSNVISMMIGELYYYNGIWKFNAVGNGVAKDLAGLCTLYGVQIND